MTFGQLFTVMNPDVKVRENSTCVWLFFDEVNHYTIAAEWWKREIPDYAVELLKEQDPVKPIRLENWWKCPSCSGNIVANMNYCPRCGKAVKWE